MAAARAAKLSPHKYIGPWLAPITDIPDQNPHDTVTVATLAGAMAEAADTLRIGESVIAAFKHNYIFMRRPLIDTEDSVVLTATKDTARSFIVHSMFRRGGYLHVPMHIEGSGAFTAISRMLENRAQQLRHDTMRVKPMPLPGDIQILASQVPESIRPLVLHKTLRVRFGATLNHW